MKKEQKHMILGVPFDLIGFDEAVARVARGIGRREPSYVTFTNPRVVMDARKDMETLGALKGSGLVLPDGIGIILAARLLGYPSNGRVDGPSFMLQFFNETRHRGYRHFFCGGRPGVAEKLSENMMRQFGGFTIAGVYSPPFKPSSGEADRETIDRINRTDPDVVWVGLGAPKQEKWMAAHLGAVKAPVMIGVGAAFDFNSGNLSRAPDWAVNNGFEWFYRFFENPRRDIRRKLSDAAFLVGVVCESILMQRRKSATQLN